MLMVILGVALPSAITFLNVLNDVASLMLVGNTLIGSYDKSAMVIDGDDNSTDVAETRQESLSRFRLYL